MVHLINELYWWFKKRSNLLIISLFLIICFNQSSALFTGGLINSYTRLSISNSPFYIKDDIFIEKNGELRIDSGVILYFAPRKGITVKGKLTARVSGFSIKKFLRTFFFFKIIFLIYHFVLVCA